MHFDLIKKFIADVKNCHSLIEFIADLNQNSKL
jgi:hypothetical protein